MRQFDIRVFRGDLVNDLRHKIEDCSTLALSIDVTLWRVYEQIQTRCGRYVQSQNGDNLGIKRFFILSATFAAFWLTK